MKKYFAQKGFATFLPLLVISFFIVSIFAIYGGQKSDTPTQVLSETTESERENREQTQVRLVNDSEEDRVEIETQNNEDEDREEENEMEDEIEDEDIEDEDEFESEIERTIKEGTVSSKIKIRSGNNKFEFEEESGKIRVRTNFPLSVNPTTRELTVSTPAGVRIVAVLPEKAISNMIEAGFVTTAEATTLSTGGEGELVYEVEGIKEEKLLGLFKINLRRRVSVSATTGDVVTINQTTSNQILDIFSI